jgi:hypothetical protein
MRAMNEQTRIELTASLGKAITKWIDEAAGLDCWADIGWCGTNLESMMTRAAILVLEASAEGSKAAEENRE